MGLDLYLDPNKLGVTQEDQSKVWLSSTPEVGYFRDCYNNYSLANWLRANVDEKAKGNWGMSIFMEPEKFGFKSTKNSKFRSFALKTVCEWYEKAKTLKDRPSKVGYNGEIGISPKETNKYIEWLEELVKFCQVAVEKKSPIMVWG